MTNTSRHLRQAVRFTLAAFATTAAAPMAFAQTAPAAKTADAAPMEVVVTGSRLQSSPNDVSVSPVTSVTALDIQQTGLTRTEDLLNNLPQVIAENSSGQSISSNGTATVSLRGLGSQRTLVLINGRRMSPGAGLGTSSAADLNQIPAELIKSIEVLTGGASAVYGADAVAGVVNFHLDTDFEGVKFDANYSYGSHKNDNSRILGLLAAKNNPAPPGTINAGQVRDISFMAGSKFADGRGSATVYATYLNQAPAIGYQYDYAGCTLNTPGSLPKTITAPQTKKYSCGGSSSSATGRFLLLGQLPTSKGGVTSTALADQTVNPEGTFRGYSSAKDSYNYGALSYLQRQAERYTAGAFLNYEISEHAKVYSETMYARNTSTAQYGPSGLFAFGTPTISCDNPLLTATEVSTLCSPANIAANHAQFPNAGLGANQILLYAARRSVESGPRLDNYSSNSIRQVIGVNGKINDVWNYDASGMVGISQMEDIEGNFLGTQQINNALNVVPDPRPGANQGKAVCQSVLNGSDPACVPWNIWTPGGVTQNQLDYLRVQSSYAVKSTEYIVNGNINGDLGKYGVKVPTAAEGMSALVGAEYREEKYDFDPDYIFAHGFASGGNGAFSAIHGQFHVSEVFTEMRLPLVDEKPGIYHLGLEGAYRYSSYTSGFNTNTYKFNVEYSPVQDYTLRGGYNRSVRAPNIGDLYTPQVIGSGGTADPCWGPTPSYTQAQCANTGVTAQQYGHILPNPAAQINTTAGGNINLKPEIADTFSVGLVAKPLAVPSLVVTVDYYDIKIKNTIESLTSNTVIAACANSGILCDQIHRGPSGSLWFNNSNFINTNEVNIGKVTVKGFDVTARYTVQMNSWGKVNLGLTGVKTQSWLTQPLPSGGAYDCTGYFGSTCGSPTFKWAHTFVATWATPWAGLDLTAKWRYKGPVDVDRSSSDPQLNAIYYKETSHIGSYNYLDLSASIPLGSSGASFRLGVNNITDKAPPIILNGNYSDCPNLTCNDNTFVGTYDTLGRFIYAHASMKF